MPDIKQPSTFDPRNLSALYDVHLWDIPVATLESWAGRLDAMGSTRETRIHASRIRRNISLRASGTTYAERVARD